MARWRRKAGGVNSENVVHDDAQGVAHDAHVGPRANPVALGVPESAPLLSTADGQPIAREISMLDMAAKTSQIPVCMRGG